MANIQEFVVERQIQFLWHFTRLENLDSILERGLHTRGQCADLGISPATNDAYRLDCADAICLSLSFPNYKMFYRLRKENPATQWGVVAVSPKVLWEKDCAFCRENAAKSTVTSIPIAQRKGVTALRALYDDFEDKPRATLNIPQSNPTNPQAEVLVFDHIGPEYIVGAAFKDDPLTKQYVQQYSQYQFASIPGLFGARVDYKHWGPGG